MSCLLCWDQYQSLPLWNWSRLRGAGYDACRKQAGPGAEFVLSEVQEPKWNAYPQAAGCAGGAGRPDTVASNHSQPAQQSADGTGTGEPDSCRLRRHGEYAAGCAAALPAGDRRGPVAGCRKSGAKSSAVHCRTGQHQVAERLDRFSSRIARTLDRAVCYDTVRGSASGREKPPDGSGWESNPPGPFSEATPGLKPGAVTRSTYTPSSSCNFLFSVCSQSAVRTVFSAVSAGNPGLVRIR